MATASLCQEQAKPSPGVVSPRGPCSSLVFKVWSQMATSVAPRSLLKMQTLNSFPRPVGTGNYILTGCHLPIPLGSVRPEPTAGVTRKVSVCQSLSCVRLFVTPIAWSPPGSSLSIEFSRQEYWSGLPFHSPGDRPSPGPKPRSPTPQANSLPSEPSGKPCQQEGLLKHKCHPGDSG